MRTFTLHDQKTGEVTFEGVEASRSRRCPVCQKPDWCLIDAARGLVICPRTPSFHKIGEAGWLHGQKEEHRKLSKDWTVEALNRVAFSKPKPQPVIDWVAMFKPWWDKTTTWEMTQLANELCLGIKALDALTPAWSDRHNAWAFPMMDANRRIIGIRLRATDGRKWAVQGSRNGLFYPEPSADGPILLPEGPTDTAAALTLGFDAIGRPFCRGGMEMMVDAIAELKRPAVVVADQDTPGIEGAKALADALHGVASWVKVIRPPAQFKDIRAWLQGGATHEAVMHRIEATGFHKP